jgi:hypothetical protein
MNIIFDTLTGELTIDTSTIHPYGADIQALLNRHGNVINLQGVEMSLTIHADGEQVFFTQLPPPGVRYEKTDQDLLATAQAHWLPDQEITVHVWCRTSTGQEVTADANFTSPRPSQPYPSWIWVDRQWTAPVPYPIDGGMYQWDEDEQAWIEAGDGRWPVSDIDEA